MVDLVRATRQAADPERARHEANVETAYASLGRDVVRALIEGARNVGHMDELPPDAPVVVAVVMSADGRFVLSKGQRPVVVATDLVLSSVDDKTGKVEIAAPDQLVSPKEAARLAAVHKATVERAVIAGELPEPFQVSSRRVGHKLSDVVRWMQRRQK